jgi:hypothetical protein
MTDEPIEGCESYDWMELPADRGFRVMIYWKAAATRWPNEYAVFLDPRNRFYSRPFRLASLCEHSPIHVPLEGVLEGHPLAASTYEMNSAAASALLERCGLRRPHHFARPALVMIRTRAVDRVCEIVQEFRYLARGHGAEVNLALAITYAVQMLCANRETHFATARPDLWLPESALSASEIEVLQSRTEDWRRSVRLLSLPSLVYLGSEEIQPDTGRDNAGLHP